MICPYCGEDLGEEALIDFRNRLRLYIREMELHHEHEFHPEKYKEVKMTLSTLEEMIGTISLSDEE